MYYSKRKGFSVIELSIMVVIIAVISAGTFLTYASYLKDRTAEQANNFLELFSMATARTAAVYGLDFSENELGLPLSFEAAVPLENGLDVSAGDRNLLELVKVYFNSDFEKIEFGGRSVKIYFDSTAKAVVASVDLENTDRVFLFGGMVR
jgi:type II secretory pathway pseudopilin PulG